MSIVVSVKVYDGIVLGAYSQAQILGKDAQGNVGVIKTYSNARKLFQLGKFPMGVVVYGAANIEKRSIENLLHEFNEKILKKEQSVREATNQLFSFFSAKHQQAFGGSPPAEQPILGALVAGYSKEQDLPEEWEFMLPRDSQPKEVRPIDQFGASWRGITLPFNRLYLGLDHRIVDKLEKLGVSPEILSQIKGGIPTPIIFDSMPLQDALDFAKFIMNVTINIAKVEPGSESCGGPLDLAVIKHEGFNWVEQKPLDKLLSP